MEELESVEEEVTRSNFALLENHNLDIKGSKGLFKERIPDLSAIERQETTTQPFLMSKSSASSVFDRLLSDTNRRVNASMKIQDYRLMLELEYENSFLNPTRISHKTESNLVSRLLLDSQRRKNNKLAAEELKKSQSPIRKFVKWPVEKTNEVVKRLAVDKREQLEKRERLRKSALEQEVMLMKSFREKKHPKRKIDEKIMSRVLGSVSPGCKCEKKEVLEKKKSWKEIKEVVERLHKKSPIRIFVKGSEVRISPPKSARPGASPSKRSHLEADDYLMTLKAKGKGLRYDYKSA